MTTKTFINFANVNELKLTKLKNKIKFIKRKKILKF